MKTSPSVFAVFYKEVASADARSVPTLHRPKTLRASFTNYGVTIAILHMLLKEVYRYIWKKRHDFAAKRHMNNLIVPR